MYGNQKVVDLLLEHGAKLVEPSRNDLALGKAAEIGNTSIVKAIIEENGPDNINHQNEQLQTPLILAADRGDTEVAKILLKHNADVNMKDVNENTALIAAIKSRTLAAADLVSVLMEHGAKMININHKGSSVTCLGLAVHYCDNDIVTALIKHGADVNELDGDGETALSLAAGEGFMDIVKNLLDHGARLDLGSPLINAAEHGETEALALLLQQQGANIENKNKYGNTALLQAIISMSPSSDLGQI